MEHVSLIVEVVFGIWNGSARRSNIIEKAGGLCNRLADRGNIVRKAGHFDDERFDSRSNEALPGNRHVVILGCEMFL
ncbi:hypothetical protein AMTR_s00120p00056170 [Amborella trichopoda]|uniref:Uncharacterized protein n=1 Tax=Amborella trichopoda TaxID=13333 RepID=W1NTT1_AMBTC|nr:hypothetical protein AMTR_s00120p00056170 [Amborella trichopoda]